MEGADYTAFISLKVNVCTSPPTTTQPPEVSKGAAGLGKVGSAPPLVSTVELSLLAEVWVSQPWCCEHRRVVPIAHLSCGGMGRVKIPPITTTICAQGRWKSWPLHFAWAIQQSWPWRYWCWRTDYPEDLNARELYSSLQDSQDNAGEFTWCWRQGRAGGLTNP